MRRRVPRLIGAVILATGLVLVSSVATTTASNHTTAPAIAPATATATATDDGAEADGTNADAADNADAEAESGGAVLVIGFILVGSGAAVVAARLARRTREADDSL